MKSNPYDVLIVGGGNAALCAALSAREQGARVVVLERAPQQERGGNSTFTGGGMRFVYHSPEEIYKIADLTPEEIANTDFGTYTENRFFDDLYRVTQYRTNPDLAEVLIKGSNAAVYWLRGQGVHFVPGYGRHAARVNGKFKFSAGVTVGAAGEGRGLVDTLYAAAARAGIDVYYNANVKSLLYDDHGVQGVDARINGKSAAIRSIAVILACGGFEANAEWRTRYLGFGWDLAKVRGSRFNTGDGIRMAIEIGAQPYGNWSGAHAAAWDLNAPAYGDINVGDGYGKQRYPYGIMINTDGKRFLDEGADFNILTYAKYGRIILAQPGQMAWQIFDSKVIGLLGHLYNIKQMTRVRANSLEDLASKLEGVNKAQFLETVAHFNGAVQQNVSFNPTIKDGRGTSGLKIEKSNWAQTISDGPFEAYAVTCGITFTFGGLKITTQSEVVDTEEQPIRGLYAAGELVGGIFYFNYPGGSGLTSGTVFGRIAGKSAANFCKQIGS